MTDAPAARAFEAHAAHYDAMRRRLIPPFDAFYGTAVAAAGLGGPPERILELGAGTGLLSRRLADAYPETELTLLDAAPAMLAEAEQSLGDRARYLTGDMTDPLPQGRYDAIVSALAIHHLADPRKLELFGRAHAALNPGGTFVNAEQVAGPTPETNRLYAEWHRSSALAAGATDEDWAAAEQRMRFDRCATLEQQLEWLRGAGFPEADCVFEDHCFAVLVARRAA
jgi:tRNA (cmo5U34)-methyltransferase